MTDWHKIVDEYGPMVFRIARRILGHTADADDVCQDVLHDAYRLSLKKKVQSWPGLLMRLASLRSVDRLRQRKTIVQLDQVSLAHERDNPHATAIANELAERLRVSLTQLPQQQAATFALRYFEGLSNGEIAECLQMSASGVSTSLSKARDALSILLDEKTRGANPS